MKISFKKILNMINFLKNNNLRKKLIIICTTVFTIVLFLFFISWVNSYIEKKEVEKAKKEYYEQKKYDIENLDNPNQSVKTSKAIWNQFWGGCSDEYEDYRNLPYEEKDLLSKSAHSVNQLANSGFCPAQVLLGDLWCHPAGAFHFLLIGDPIQPNYYKAAFWYQQAANQKDGEAMWKLGGMYENGIGVSKNIEKAVYWYKQSAYQGNSDGQLTLGDYFQKGVIGILETNHDSAVFYWQSAKKNGNIYAQDRLERIYD